MKENYVFFNKTKTDKKGCTRVTLCDGGAYLLSVAALPSPLPTEGGYSFTTPMLL